MAASSIYPVTGSAIHLGTASALTGDGTSGSPLEVVGDGTTVDINGSNQLEAIGLTSAAQINIALVQATTFKSHDGTTGASAGPFTVITGITIKNGLVTALTGS